MIDDPWKDLNPGIICEVSVLLPNPMQEVGARGRVPLRALYIKHSLKMGRRFLIGNLRRTILDSVRNTGSLEWSLRLRAPLAAGINWNREHSHSLD